MAAASTAEVGLSGLTTAQLIAHVDKFIEDMDDRRRRREAADRLPPLADGRRDPDLEPAKRVCCDCGAREDQAELAVIRGRTWCRDRVECWQRKTGRTSR